MLAPAAVSELAAEVWVVVLLTTTYRSALPVVVICAPIVRRIVSHVLRPVHGIMVPSQGSYSPGQRTGPVGGGVPARVWTPKGWVARYARSASVSPRGIADPGGYTSRPPTRSWPAAGPRRTIAETAAAAE